MLVEIWSDVVCPWCYIGKRRLEAALGRFEHRDRVEVVWRSFELDPDAPREREGPYDERLADKYRTTLQDARAMIERMVGAAAAEGLHLRFDLARPGNTFDAHRLLHLARPHGVQDDLKERLLEATFTAGRPVGDPAVLAEIAQEAGLPAAEVAETLGGGAFGDDVRADEHDARRLGVTGVPFFAFDRRYGVAGAQSPEVLLDALRRAWHEREAASA